MKQYPHASIVPFKFSIYELVDLSTTQTFLSSKISFIFNIKPDTISPYHYTYRRRTLNTTSFRSQYSIGVPAIFENVIKILTNKQHFGNFGLQEISREKLKPREQFALFGRVFDPDRRVSIFRLPINDVYIAVTDEKHPGKTVYSWIKLTMTTLQFTTPGIDGDKSRKQMERMLDNVHREAKMQEWESD